MKTICGIYQIVQIGKSRVVYVGASQNVKRRLEWHTRELNRGKHNNPHLQNVWTKYGGDDFQLELIEEVSADKLIEREQYWMDQLKPLCNLMQAAENGAGWKHGPETLRKLSIANKGKSVSEETRRKMGERSKRQWANPEYRAKIVAATIGNKSYHGHTHTEEYKQLISKLTKKRMEDNPELRDRIGNLNRGKRLSDDVRQKISKSSKGKVISPETRKKIGDSTRGKKRSPETCKKIGDAHRGMVMSAEARKKISNARLGKKLPPFSEEHKAKLREVLRKANEKRYGKKDDST